MVWNVSSINRSALPDGLLPTVKDHVRAADFTDDDSMLKIYTGVAIAQLEHVWGLRLFAVTIAWQPAFGIDYPTLAAYPTPVQPASSFTAKDGDDVDVSGDYGLADAGSLTSPTLFYAKDGKPIGSNIVVSLVGGFTAPADLPPEMLGPILQVTARHYEYRENVSALNLSQLPLGMNDLLTGLWQPRV